MALTESEELELLELEEQEAMASQAKQSQPQSLSSENKSSDLPSMLYHGAIEGGAMAIGGTAGAVLGSPAGPVGSALGATGLAAAMYPPAKRVAESIDRMRGITPSPQESPAKEFGQGLTIEATGAALKPVANAIGKILPGAKTGEMLSGTTASNLKRAYKQGFYKTYIAPEARSETGAALGKAKSKLMQDYLTPEDQAAMLVNPRGEANSKISDVYVKFLKGGEISPQEAVATKQAIDTVYPPETARNVARIPKFAEFRSKLNEVLGEAVPEYKAKNDAAAASILRSQLSKPFRVNKSNPDQYSKLSGILAGLMGAGSAASGSALPVLGYALGTSPLAMGTTAALAGSVNKVAGSVVSNPVARRAIISQFIENHSKGQVSR